jgi:hypothetical protein
MASTTPVARLLTTSDRRVMAWAIGEDESSELGLDWKASRWFPAISKEPWLP